MSDQDIFTDNTNTEDNQPTDTNDQGGQEELKSQADIFAEKLMSITREDGTPKYNDLGQALDALKAAQEHIQRIEGENKTFKKQLEELSTSGEKLKELEEVVRRMTETPNTQNTNEEKPEVGNPGEGGGLSKEAAAQIFRELLEEREQVTSAVQNIKNVQEALVNKYGGAENANAMIKEKAAELGITTEKLKEMSATNPKVVLALFGGNNTSSKSPTTSSINTGGFKPQVEELPKPEKSLISGPGATDTNRKEYWQKIRAKVYKDLGVEA